MNQLPQKGYVRLKQILGNPKEKPPIPPIIPIGKSSWWQGIKEGKYPKPVKLTISSTTKGTRQLCKEIDFFPDQKTLYVWLRKHDEFNQQYVKAKRAQIEPLVDAMLDVIDDETDTNRARLKIDTYKWLAAKLVPKVYGRDSQLDEQSTDECITEKLKEIKAKCGREY